MNHLGSFSIGSNDKGEGDYTQKCFIEKKIEGKIEPKIKDGRIVMIPRNIDVKMLNGHSAPNEMRLLLYCGGGSFVTSRENRRTMTMYVDENDNWHFIKREASCFAPDRIESWGLAYRLMDDSQYHYDNAYNMSGWYHGGIRKDIQWSVTFDIFEKNPATTCERSIEVITDVLRSEYGVFILICAIGVLFSYVYQPV